MQRPGQTTPTLTFEGAAPEHKLPYPVIHQWWPAGDSFDSVSESGGRAFLRRRDETIVMDTQSGQILRIQRSRDGILTFERDFASYRMFGQAHIPTVTLDRTYSLGGRLSTIIQTTLDSIVVDGPVSPDAFELP